jgi:hypothetical protein
MSRATRESAPSSAPHAAARPASRGSRSASTGQGDRVTVDHAGVALAMGAASSAVLVVVVVAVAVVVGAPLTVDTATAAVDAEPPHAAASSNGRTVAARHRMATTLARGHAREKEKRRKPEIRAPEATSGGRPPAAPRVTIRVLTVGKAPESFARVTVRTRIVARAASRRLGAAHDRQDPNRRSRSLGARAQLSRAALADERARRRFFSAFRWPMPRPTRRPSKNPPPTASAMNSADNDVSIRCAIS